MNGSSEGLPLGFQSPYHPSLIFDAWRTCTKGCGVENTWCLCCLAGCLAHFALLEAFAFCHSEHAQSRVIWAAAHDAHVNADADVRQAVSAPLVLAAFALLVCNGTLDANGFSSSASMTGVRPPLGHCLRHLYYPAQVYCAVSRARDRSMTVRPIAKPTATLEPRCLPHRSLRMPLRSAPVCTAAGLPVHSGRPQRGAGGGDRTRGTLDRDRLAGPVCRLAHMGQLFLAGSSAEPRSSP